MLASLGVPVGGHDEMAKGGWVNGWRPELAGVETDRHRLLSWALFIAAYRSAACSPLFPLIDVILVWRLSFPVFLNHGVKNLHPFLKADDMIFRDVTRLRARTLSKRIRAPWLSAASSVTHRARSSTAYGSLMMSVPKSTFLDEQPGSRCCALIVELAARYQLPAIYPFAFYAKEGGLISYGFDAADQIPAGRRLRR